MATPANRVPVRIARGSKANLDTAIAAGDLREGEICYATDENGIYVVEGGALTQAGADLASTSIDALSDVDTTTAAPTDGQVLIWNNVDGEWQPGDRLADVVSDTTPQLGGNLDVNGNYIVSASGGNVEIAPDTTGDLIVRGNNTDGSITLNCTANTHGVKIQSPPHSAAASYTLVLPDDTGTNGDALVTDGSGGLSWAAPGADLSASSIDALSDVDTTTVAPTDGQALVWDNANSQWEPGTVASGSVASIDDIGDVDTTTVPPTDGQALVWDNANSQWEPGTVSGGGGGAVDSVNSQTGTVSLGIEDMDDFALQAGTFPYWATKEGTGSPSAGEWFPNGSNFLRVNPVDSNGTDWSSEMTTLGVSGTATFWYSTDGTSWTETVNDGGFDNLPTWFQFDVVPFNVNSHTGAMYISFSDPATAPGAPLVDGDLLQYNTTESKFKPVQLGIDDLADVDTTTAAPTDGQALVWDNAASKWEPGTISGGITQIQDASDYGLYPAASPNWDTECGGCSFPTAGEWSDQVSKIRLDSTDSNGTDHLTALQGLIVGSDIWVSQDGVSWTQSTVNSYTSYAPGDPTLFAVGVTAVTDPTTYWSSGTAYLSFEDPATATIPLAEGDILSWVASASEFRPAQPRSAAEIRTLLGIGEYADDTAAGTGGVASGAMYYNTTSSDYRLKS